MNNSSTSGAVGFVWLLTIVFITLKLVGYIDWSWWWVLSPIWISVAIGIAAIVIAIVIAIAIDLIK